MGDWFQAIVDKDASEQDAPRLASEIHYWLVTLGIVSEKPTDCILGGENGGFSPGPNYGLAVDEEDNHLHKLSTNGLELVTERTVFYGGQGAVELVCSACAARFDAPDEFMEAIGVWHRKAGPAVLECTACGHSLPIEDWPMDPQWGFANLGFQFWNWPSLKKSFIAEITKRLQHRTVFLEGKL